MTKYLGDIQFGLGFPNGAKEVHHSANMFLNSYGFLAMLVDFSNAFNLVDRTVLRHKVRTGAHPFHFGYFLYGQ